MFNEKNNISEETKEIYNHFKNQSNFLANPISEEALLQIAKTYQPKRVLEWGGGYGTVSYIFLKYTDAKIDIYESLDFCREKIHENLRGFEDRYTIHKNYMCLPPHREYDIMIVDAGGRKKYDTGFSKLVWIYLHYLTNIRVIYFDGSRHLQRIWARKALRSSYTYTLTTYPRQEYEGMMYKGGLKIDCKKNKSSITRWINYIFWELYEWKPIKYYFRYRYRKLKVMLGKLNT